MSLYKIPIRKNKKYLGLNKLNILHSDVTPAAENSFKLSEIPNILSAGKNIIKIAGTNNLMYLSEISIEILDTSGDPIYWEIDKYIDISKRRIITIWIYPETPTGDAEITILGILNKNFADNIPDEFKDLFNIKWSKKIFVDADTPNSTSIIFANKPVIIANEIFKTINKPIFNQGSVSKKLYGDGPGAIDTTKIEYFNNAGTRIKKFDNYDISSNISKPYKNNNEKLNIWTTWNKNSITSNTGQLSLKGLNTSYDKNQYYSPLIEKNDIEKLKSIEGIILKIAGGSFKFKKEHTGGTLKINNPVEAKLSPASSNNGATTGSYSTEITKVINGTTIRVRDLYKDSLNRDILNFKQSNFEVTHSINPDSHTSTPAYENFANFRFSNLNPISGDIYKIRIYARQRDSINDKFELIADKVLEQSNLLIDTNTSQSNLEIGLITTQSMVTTYWSASSYQNTNTTSSVQPAASSVSAVFNDINIEGGICVTSSQLNGTIDTGFAKLQPLINNAPYTTSIFSGSNYLLEFDIYGSTIKNNFENDGILYVCLSGSSIYNTPNGIKEKKIFNDASFTGQILHKISINDTTKIENGTILLDNTALMFSPDKDGKITPVFIIQGGKWNFSNIKLLSYSEIGFNPSHVEFDVPIDPKFDNSNLDFKIEFLDYLGNVSSDISYLFNVPISGGKQIFLQGNKNISIGKLTLSNEFNSGLEIETTKSIVDNKFGTVFRSSGYTGFDDAVSGIGKPGFLLYSGSVSSSNSYGGIGFELASPDVKFKFITSASNGSSSLEILATKIEATTIIISGSNAVTSSLWTGSTSGIISRNSNVEITGSLNVSGKITAEEYHTEFVSSSIIYSSGSTKFGDTIDDTHLFTGSLFITGSTYISGNLEISNTTKTFSARQGKVGIRVIPDQDISNGYFQIKTPISDYGWVHYDATNNLQLCSFIGTTTGAFGTITDSHLGFFIKNGGYGIFLNSPNSWIRFNDGVTSNSPKSLVHIITGSNIVFGDITGLRNSKVMIVEGAIDADTGSDINLISYEASSGSIIFGIRQNAYKGAIEYFPHPTQNNFFQFFVSGSDGIKKVIKINPDSLELTGSMKIMGSLFIPSSSIPATSNNSGSLGQFTYDKTYLYLCTGSNGWGRIAWDTTSW